MLEVRKKLYRAEAVVVVVVAVAVAVVVVVVVFHMFVHLINITASRSVLPAQDPSAERRVLFQLIVSISAHVKIPAESLIIIYVCLLEP